MYLVHSQKNHQKTGNFHQIILYILTLLYSEYQWDFNRFQGKIIRTSPTKVRCGTLGARIVAKTCAKHPQGFILAPGPLADAYRTTAARYHFGYHFIHTFWSIKKNIAIYMTVPHCSVWTSAMVEYVSGRLRATQTCLNKSLYFFKIINKSGNLQF